MKDITEGIWMVGVCLPLEEWARFWGVDEEELVKTAEELGMGSVVESRKASAWQMDRIISAMAIFG